MEREVERGFDFRLIDWDSVNPIPLFYLILFYFVHWVCFRQRKGYVRVVVGEKERQKKRACELVKGSISLGFYKSGICIHNGGWFGLNLVEIVK